MPQKELMELLIAEFWERGIPDLTQRDRVFHKVQKKIHVAIGMRRSGKTFFLFQKIESLLEKGVPKNRILYLQLDDERILPLNGKELGQMVDAFYSLYPKNHEDICYLFFDEIQNVSEWSHTIRRLLDTKKAEIYLTGSSAKLLSKEIATSLRGRSLATEIYPFSFKEYYRHVSKTISDKPRSPKQRDMLQKDLESFLINGGFPEISKLQDSADRKNILQEYLNVTVYRDIVERHSITNINLLKYFVSILVGNMGNPFTVNKCFNDLKSQGFSLGKDTLYDYLEFTQDCYLVFPVKIFSDSIRKQNINPRKIYIIDPGLFCANIICSSPPWGRLFENLVFLDLMRAGHEVAYYLTRDNGFEVDFVTKSSRGEHCLYQVCWDITDNKTREREDRALQQASQDLGIKGEIITPANYFDFLSNI
ncbi:MAG: ATP-binding protein [bacterium]